MDLYYYLLSFPVPVVLSVCLDLLFLSIRQAENKPLYKSVGGNSRVKPRIFATTLHIGLFNVMKRVADFVTARNGAR